MAGRRKGERSSIIEKGSTTHRSALVTMLRFAAVLALATSAAAINNGLGIKPQMGYAVHSVPTVLCSDNADDS